MSATRILIKGGTIVNADRSYAADVLCEGGVITEIGIDLAPQGEVTLIDASGKLLIPGGIDTHTHMQLPFMGTIAADDFETGTKACLAGGTTFILDFVIPSPGESLIKSYDKWREWAEKSCCAYNFHVAVTSWIDGQTAEEMTILSNERGINSYKHFLAYKGSLMLDDNSCIMSMSKCKELGALPMFHCENGELVLLGQKSMLAQGITGPEGHALSRPCLVEAEAVNHITRIAEALQVPLYIVHVSAGDSVDVIARARSQGQRVYGEVLAGHLTIDDSVYRNTSWRFAAGHVMSPPFRPAGNPERLWTGLQAGALQTTATDHCVFCYGQKAMSGKSDFTKIPNGCNGVEERLSVLWEHGVLTGKLSENQFVEATSTAAARIFNFYPKKGVIAIGSDADIVVWNATATRKVEAATHKSKVDFNIFEGWVLHGVPEITIYDGKVVWSVSIVDGVADWAKGIFSCEKGSGKWVDGPLFGTPYAGMNKLSGPHGVQRTTDQVDESNVDMATVAAAARASS